MRKISVYIILSVLILWSCDRGVQNPVSGPDAAIFPDYRNITVPVNIAPANFMIQDTADKYITLLESGDVKVKVTGKKVVIPIRKWRKLTAQGNIAVNIFEKKGKEWIRMNSFGINVADEIDSYLTYRVIPPLFESYQRLTINQRDITTFSEKVVYANSMVSHGTQTQCINCHSFKNWHTDNMQFHIRQYLGGTST